MTYLNTHDRTVSPTQQDVFQPMGRSPTLYGVFMGFVKDTADVQKMGRLRVWIPEFGSAPEEDNGWITVSYCSPFAGATNVFGNNATDIKTFEGTQTSYGMWMIPPDVNNQVLIMFINGDPAKGVWIGCMYNQFMNNMIPGMAASDINYQYNGVQVPVAEYNKNDKSVTIPDKALHPYEATKFNGIGNQGLITDMGRGVTNSSARRESPSNVFGIITPGPIINNTSSTPVDEIRRKGGSSFIMDDGVGTEYTQLATKSGAQIKIDETNGFVYLINRDGTAWIQMDQKGNIDIFGATNISMRAQQDINLRADRNINIEAGQNIYMKAAKDTSQTTTTFTYDVNNLPNAATIPYYKYVGEGAGTGGNIVMQALNNAHTTISNNSYLTIKNDLNIQASGKTYLTTANLDINVNSNLKMQSGSEMDISSGSLILMKGSALGFTGPTIFSDSVGVSGNFTAGGAQNTLFNSVSLGDPGTVDPAANPGSPDSATAAEVKPLVQKINILATWGDSVSKFKRNSEQFQTTVSTLPTYEPCPEHEKFTFKSITGYVPTYTDGGKTYSGSGGAGNDATSSPATNTDPGANNTDLPPNAASENATVKDFNMAAYECQLKIHEGVKYSSYLDSLNLPTAGIGHLLRSNEVSTYPVPTPVSSMQVDSWFQSDAVISISGAQQLLGIDVWADLTDIRKRACADLCYNLGKSRLSKFTQFLSAIIASDYGTAGQALRNSKWFTQVGRRGPNIITMIVNNVDPNGCDIRFG